MAGSVELKRAVAYSLLAHINNSGSLIKGQLDIFVPIVKKGLHYMCILQQKPKGESIQEIGDVITDKFGIEIPIPVLRNILKIIVKELNTQDKKLLTVNNDDSFWVHDYVFEEYDEIIQQGQSDLKNLQTLFEKFCEMNNVKQNIGIVKFIEKNKVSISSYLANKPVINGSECTIEAKFVDYFKNMSPQIYSQIRNIYLGSILTSFLEYQPSNAQMNVDLLLDTNFIISLIDLNTPESTKTCNKLLEIGKNIGYSFHVLQDTIEEAKGLLRYKAENFDHSIIQKFVNREDVYNACNRLNYTKTDLDRIADNIEKSLQKLGVCIVPHTDTYKNKARFSKEYQKLKPYRNTDKAALHDAMCIVYVKEKRNNKSVHKIEEVNCWWVNNAISHDFDNDDISSILSGEIGHSLPEMIKVDDLLNILWLTCPNLNNVDFDAMVDMGLSSLIAYSFNQSLPKAKIIKELDENIQKYRNEDITDRDVLLLSTRIANGQIKDIEKINELSKTDVRAFNDRIKAEAQKQEKIEQEQYNKLEEIVSEFKKGLEELKEHKRKIDESGEKRVQQAIATHKKEKEDVVTRQKEEIERLRLENNRKENELRKIKREAYIKKQLRKWRWKTWWWIIGLFVVLVFGITWIINAFGNIKEVNNLIDGLMQNQIISVIVSLVVFVVEIFLIKNIYDKHCNHSNIEAYKKTLHIPDDLKSLE